MENEVFIPNEGSNSSQTEQESNSNQAKKLTIGTLGWWIGPLEEKRLGIIIDNDTLKLYEKSCYDYVPGMYKVESDFDFFPTPLFYFFPKGIYKYIYIYI